MEDNGFSTCVLRASASRHSWLIQAYPLRAGAPGPQSVRVGRLTMATFTGQKGPSALACMRGGVLHSGFEQGEKETVSHSKVDTHWPQDPWITTGYWSHVLGVTENLRATHFSPT